MAYKPSVKLELNDSKFPKWNNITLKQSLNALAGISMSMPNPAGQYTSLPFKDMPIKLFLGWDTDDPPLRFDGTMDDPKFNIQSSGATLALTGRDFGKILFDEMTVNQYFESLANPIGKGYIKDYVQYLNYNLSTPLDELFSRNTVDDNNPDFEYVFEMNKSLEALKKLASYGNYEWFMLLDQNNNRKFTLRPPQSLVSTNVAHSFIVGSELNYSDIPSASHVHHIEQIQVNKNYGYQKN